MWTCAVISCCSPYLAFQNIKFKMNAFLLQTVLTTRSLSFSQMDTSITYVLLRLLCTLNKCMELCRSLAGLYSYPSAIHSPFT